jgi:purine-nucleoside/S-methyl-5'-thioadenosine phosphorylase / adenosine deaminase
MEWRVSGGVEWLEASLPGVRAAFSTRSAGSVKESHVALATALGLAPERIAMAQQVHGAELAFHESVPIELPEADGHVIAEPGIAALVLVADCLPIALAGPGGAAILHCGWRGLAAGIVARGAAAVGATDAAVGPGIGPCCYEVGDEVLAAFAGLGEGVAAGRMLDLPEAARRLLGEAGVERVEVAGICTSCNPDRFFSHRREGGRTGRQAGVAWLDSEGA